MKICQKCNKTYADGNFCEICGGPLVEMEDADANVERTEKVAAAEAVPEKTCVNCGATLKGDDLFCPECGHAVNGAEVHKHEKEGAEPDRPYSEEVNERSQIKKKPNLINIILGATAAVLIIAFAVFYFWGKEHYSFENQVDQFINRLSEQDAAVIEQLTTNDPNFKITEDSIQPFFNYVKENKQYVSDLKSSLSSVHGGNEEIQVVQSGKHFLLFDKYKFVVNPVYVVVTTELEDMAISVNGEEVGTSDSADYQKEVGPLAPGVNVFTGKVKIGDEEQEVNRSVDLIASESEYPVEEIDLTIQVLSFTVESNILDGEVLLDGESVASLKDGEAEIGPFAWSEGMTLQVVKSFESGDVKSEEYVIDSYDDGETITLYVESVVDEYAVQSFLDDFYSEVSSFLSDYNDYGSEEQEALAEFFTNGKENDDFIDFAAYISENRENEDKSVSIYFDEVHEVLQIDNNKFQVVFSVDYHTYFTDWEKDSVQNNLKYTKAIFEYNEEKEALTISDLGGEDDVTVTTE